MCMGLYLYIHKIPKCDTSVTERASELEIPQQDVARDLVLRIQDRFDAKFNGQEVNLLLIIDNLLLHPLMKYVYNIQFHNNWTSEAMVESSSSTRRWTDEVPGYLGSADFLKISGPDRDLPVNLLFARGCSPMVLWVELASHHNWAPWQPNGEHSQGGHEGLRKSSYFHLVYISEHLLLWQHVFLNISTPGLLVAISRGTSSSWVFTASRWSPFSFSILQDADFFARSPVN